jgi:hypothetical protein
MTETPCLYVRRKLFLPKLKNPNSADRIDLGYSKVNAGFLVLDISGSL